MDMTPTTENFTPSADLARPSVADTVIGAVAGLLTAGFLSESLGGIGRAVALTDIAPFIVAVALIPFLPEARGRDLDDVSPSEA